MIAVKGMNQELFLFHGEGSVPIRRGRSGFELGDSFHVKLSDIKLIVHGAYGLEGLQGLVPLLLLEELRALMELADRFRL